MNKALQYRSDSDILISYDKPIGEYMRKILNTVSQTSLINEWNFKRNSVNPCDVLVRCRDKFWWTCDKGHEWETSPLCRRANKSGCHICSGKIVLSERSFGVLNPSLLQEWDYEKNEHSPSSYLPQSNKKVWWKCIKGHSWDATIHHRVKDASGCPFCMNGWQTSRLELRVLSELQYIFSDTIGRSKVGGVECDVYIPSLRFGIEIDGYHWHLDKVDRDREKNAVIESSGNKLVRVREKPLEKIRDTDVLYTTDESEILIFKKLLKAIEIECHVGSFDFHGFKGSDKYRELLSRSRRSGKNLQSEFPNVALEWHPTRNRPLMPEDVAPRSTLSVWWLCGKCGNEYEKKVWKRASHGCPYCGGKKVWNGNSLRTFSPKIVSDWDYEKNKGLTPDDVTYGSHRRVWWRCHLCGFRWEQTVNGRTSFKRECRACHGVGKLRKEFSQ